MFRDTRRIEYQYKGEKFHVGMTGWFPRDNDDGIFTQEDMKAYNKTLHEIKNR